MRLLTLEAAAEFCRLVAYVGFLTVHLNTNYKSYKGGNTEVKIDKMKTIYVNRNVF